MPLVNRDKDQSEQRDVYQSFFNGTPSSVSSTIMNPGLSTGNTFMLATISRPCQLIAAESVVWGLSGAPLHNLWLYRFAGGFTSILMGNTLTVSAFGTSGAQNYTLSAAAVSFPLVAGDQLFLNTLVAATSVASAQITLVVKSLQDIKTDFGV